MFLISNSYAPDKPLITVSGVFTSRNLYRIRGVWKIEGCSNAHSVHSKNTPNAQKNWINHDLAVGRISKPVTIKQ